MIRIVTDGTADMPAKWTEEFEVAILPLRIHFGVETFTQGENIDHAGFYRMVEEKGMIPKTSLPSPQQLVDFYRRIAKPGETVLSIHVGGKLSGTVSVVQLAARDLKNEINVIPFDSDAGSIGIGFMCREARLMDRGGKSVEEILARLEEIRARLAIYFTVDRLEFARMSGRVTVLQSTLASLLNIKPIIFLKDGLLEMGDRVRTRKQSLEKVLNCIHERFGDQKVNFAVVHAQAPEAAEQLMQKAHSILNYCETLITDLAIPIAVHLGPGAVGIVAYPAREECLV